jgi:hypothetical protein
LHDTVKVVAYNLLKYQICSGSAFTDTAHAHFIELYAAINPDILVVERYRITWFLNGNE